MGKWDEHDPLYDDMSFLKNKKLKTLKKDRRRKKYKTRKKKKYQNKKRRVKR